MKEHLITGTESNSIAEEMGIKAGDVLIGIDGQEIVDIFDYRMLERQEELTILVRKGGFDFDEEIIPSNRKCVRTKWTESAEEAKNQNESKSPSVSQKEKESDCYSEKNDHSTDDLREEDNHVREEDNHLREEDNHLREEDNHLREEDNHLREEDNHLREEDNHLWEEDAFLEEDDNLWELDIEKEADEELGLIFESSMMDKYRSCCNGCIFCFIDQMPKGMRKTLYFKDDDARLSFLQGNYVTLTNMTDEEIDRILKYHLSPINISFHTTEPELRIAMLRNPQAGVALKKAKRLVGEDTGITLNGQIVLCKNVNDAEHLERTMRELYEDYAPNLVSVSVVPVGLTKHREKLPHLESFTQEDAKKVIAQIEAFQKRALRERGNAFIYASDEWYLLAHRDEIDAWMQGGQSGELILNCIGFSEKTEYSARKPFAPLIDSILPSDSAYDDYPQIENGVGMLRNLITEVRDGLNKLKNDDHYKTYLSEYKNEISFATGRLAYPAIGMLLAEAAACAPGLSVRLYAIQNEFFGEKITVSGLLTGTDLIKQLQGKPLGKKLYLPASLLRDGEDVLLDDVHLPEIAQKLGVTVATSGHTGYDLVAALFELAPDFFAEENSVSGYGNAYELSETDG